MNLDYDKAGHCIKCGEFLLETRLLEGRPQTVKSRKFGEKEYELSDGSRMRVLMCLACQTKPDNEHEIMEKVIKGWQVEINEHLKDKWSTEKKTAYMAKYGTLRIESNKVDVSSNLKKDKKEK